MPLRMRWLTRGCCPQVLCPDFRGSRWWLGSLGVAQGVELMSAPHSSVAVRDRERRDGARTQGQRGINGRGPLQREGGRLCRERPLCPGVRRYGSLVRRPADAGPFNMADDGYHRSEGPVSTSRRSAAQSSKFAVRNLSAKFAELMLYEPCIATTGKHISPVSAATAAAEGISPLRSQVQFNAATNASTMTHTHSDHLRIITKMLQFPMDTKKPFGIT